MDLGCQFCVNRGQPLPKPSDSQRLFIGLWPTLEVLEKLKQIQRDMSLSEARRCVALEKVHLTLLFLGDVEFRHIEKVSRAFQQIEFAEFNLRLDCTGSWPKSRVGWVGCSCQCAELNRLVTLVRSNMKNYRRDKKPFVPHLTLARNVTKKFYSVIDPIDWPVNEARLVRSTLSRKGAFYQTLAKISAVSASRSEPAA